MGRTVKLCAAPHLNPLGGGGSAVPACAALADTAASSSQEGSSVAVRPRGEAKNMNPKVFVCSLERGIMIVSRRIRPREGNVSRLADVLVALPSCEAYVC